MNSVFKLCPAKGCARSIPPARLLCETHWRMVPYELRKAVLENYRTGQERGERSVTREYAKAAKAALKSLEGA